MSGGEPDDDRQIRRHIRRRVGIAALRRLRHLVDEERAQEQRNALWASRLALAFALAAVLGWVLWWLSRG